VDKTHYRAYLQKAEEYFQAMLDSLAEERWNAAALEAIHAAISANDALLVRHYGLRSASGAHEDAIELLVAHLGTPEAKQAAQHLSRLLARKNLVEYEARLFTAKEAQEAVKHAERFLEWVRAKL
jgi:hypothetical protein